MKIINQTLDIIKKTASSIRSLKVKIAILACAVTAVFIATVIILTYIFESNLLYSAAFGNNQEMARLISAAVTRLVDRQIEAVNADASSVFFRESVKEADAKYKTMNEKDIPRYLTDMDKKWIESTGDNPFVKEYLENTVSLRLLELKKNEEGICRIIVTDRFGALIGSTCKTRSFDFSGEEWWKWAFAGEEGKTYLGNIIFDEPSGQWCLPIAAPVRNELNEVIGVYEILANIKLFFAPLEDFKIEKTGDAILTDKEGYLIFHKKAAPFTNKFCEYTELQRCLRNKLRWCIIKTAYLRRGKTIAALSEISHPLLLSRGVNWIVVVEQDAREITLPLRILASWLLLISPFLMILLTCGIFVVSNVFRRPIGRMEEAMKRIAGGDLEYRINAFSGDEVGQLAVSFNKMAADLSRQVVAISRLGQEVSKREKAEKLLSDILYAVIRIQNSLFLIKGEVESLQEGGPGSLDELKKKAIRMKDGIDILAKGIDNLMRIAKMAPSGIELKKEPIDIKDLMKKSIFIYEPEIRIKGLTLKLNIPKEALIVSFDHKLINQVFNILIEDAIKYTEKGGIEITARALKNEIELSVSDTGLGIPTDRLPAVFEITQGFILGPEAKERGANLDLALAKGIIESHNGKIWVESEPGGRTKFTFLLPKDKKDA